jgi:hypothetical protein
MPGATTNGHNSQESHQQGNHSHRQFQCRRGKFRPGGFKLFCGAHTGFDEQMIDAKFESRSSTPGDYGTGNHGTKACRRQHIAKPIVTCRERIPCLDAQ